MRKLILIIMTAVAVISATALLFAQEDTNKSKIIAYYFHTTFRCYSCSLLEKYAKETIETNFKDLIDEGLVEFKPVNVEQKGNEHFIKEYKLYTKSIILSRLKSGKEVESKNLTKIWEYVNNKDKFSNYVKDEINNFLKESE